MQEYLLKLVFSFTGWQIGSMPLIRYSYIKNIFKSNKGSTGVILIYYLFLSKSCATITDTDIREHNFKKKELNKK